MCKFDGVPKYKMSDRAKGFASKFWQQLLKTNEFKVSVSSDLSVQSPS